jgi:AcrR family transcriptional regulator
VLLYLLQGSYTDLVAVVKAKRRYRSERRKQQAEATRREIVEAARRLFTERGYVGTTMEAIAQGADVAVETVYSAFGNKRAILSRLVDISVVDDEEPTPLLEREGPQAVLREADQRRQIAMFAHDIAQIMERVSPVFEVMRTAAPAEPAIATLLDGLLQKRLEGMRFFVDALARNGPLRGKMRRGRGSETVWALTSPDLHQLFTVKLGWTSNRYEAWLRDMLEAALLP